MINYNFPSPYFYTEIINILRTGTIEDYSSDPRNIKDLAGKNIMITGAAGSIGSELVKKIAGLNPHSIGLLDINESGLADLSLELNDISNCKNRIYLCDVSHMKSIRKVFSDFKPDTVFHAAAYKHVPVLELFPEQALRVNIIGTYNVAKLSGELNSNKFVLVSTDKAVYPSSIMGRSKKVAEFIVKKIRYNYKTNYITVRFGNVIGTRGSVSEIILRQILNGGPVTLTHPEMKRYFMTISQAVNLTLIASNVGKDGNLIILDMNDPIFITDLINEFMQRLALFSESDIKTLIIGPRPGEKINEDLMTEEESRNTIYENGFYRINTSYVEEDCEQEIEYFRSYESKTYSSICNSLFNVHVNNYF